MADPNRPALDLVMAELDGLIADGLWAPISAREHFGQIRALLVETRAICVDCDSAGVPLPSYLAKKAIDVLRTSAESVRRLRYLTALIAETAGADGKVH